MSDDWWAAPTGRPRAIRSLTLVLIASGAAGCAHRPSVAVAPTPAARTADSAAPTIHLRGDWRAAVTLTRDDSILLSLPSGVRQLQRIHRTGWLTLDVDARGHFMLFLDSLTAHPYPDPHPTGESVAWSGTLDDAAIDRLHVSSGGDRARELTVLVSELLPRIPDSGVAPRSAWGDSAAGSLQIDIFHADERRHTNWRAGSLAPGGGNPRGGSIPLYMHQTFEQLGHGKSGGGREGGGGAEMTMTGQGVRNATYQMTRDGRVRRAELSDSVTMLISIPATRQMVPTLRFAHTVIDFRPLDADSSS